MECGSGVNYDVTDIKQEKYCGHENKEETENIFQIKSEDRSNFLKTETPDPFFEVEDVKPAHVKPEKVEENEDSIMSEDMCNIMKFEVTDSSIIKDEIETELKHDFNSSAIWTELHMKPEHVKESSEAIKKQSHEVIKNAAVHKRSSEMRVYKCELCPFESNYKKSFHAHKLSHRSSSELTSYKCDVCPFKTNLRGRLEHHMLSHKNGSEVVMYKCEACPFKTKYKGNLASHILRHKCPTVVPVCKCELCPYQSKSKWGLIKHMVSHKMYKCELCPYKTKHEESFKIHKSSHAHFDEQS